MKYIDSLLQPFVRKIPSYLQDTRDFIRKVEGFMFPPDSLISSLDVALLYMSILHEDIRLTIQEVLKRREDECNIPLNCRLMTAVSGCA